MLYEVTFDIGKNYDVFSTLKCGQFFRTVDTPQGPAVVSGARFVYPRQVGDKLILAYDGDLYIEEDVIEYWGNFFNIYDSWTPDAGLLKRHDWLESTFNYSRGIRILKQDPWECLLTFIVSQRNTIEKIGRTLDLLSQYSGTKIVGGIRALPTPEQLLSFDVSKCLLGYREPYVKRAAYAVVNRSIVLEELHASRCLTKVARSELCGLYGVGIKIANCVLLYGLGHENVWPVDIWIERAMAKYGITFEDVEDFGSHAGLVQQWLYWRIMRDNHRL